MRPTAGKASSQAGPALMVVAGSNAAVNICRRATYPNASNAIVAVPVRNVRAEKLVLSAVPRATLAVTATNTSRAVLAVDTSGENTHSAADSAANGTSTDRVTAAASVNGE